MGHRMVPIAFFLTNPRCRGNEIWDRIGYNSACVKDICEIFRICGGVFRNGPSNASNWILPRSTLVAMTTEFKTKWAIPRFVQQISPRSLHLTEVPVEGLAIRWRQSKSTIANFDKYNDQQCSRSSSSSKYIQRSVPDRRYTALL